MSLINIEYGSLASSDTMNKNFMYLENKIAESVGDIDTSISSLLSNIATINARISDLSEKIIEVSEDFSSKISDLKLKTEVLVNTSTMLPDWANCFVITDINAYKTPANGYVLINPKSNTSGTLTVNGVAVVLKTRANNYDNAAQLVAIPVKENDTVICSLEYNNAYFLPTKNLNFDSLIIDTEVE